MIFFDQKYSLGQNYLYSWTTNMLLGQKNFGHKLISDPKIFLGPTYILGPKYFLGQNIFQVQNIFEVKIFFRSKIFLGL